MCLSCVAEEIYSIESISHRPTDYFIECDALGKSCAMNSMYIHKLASIPIPYMLHACNWKEKKVQKKTNYTVNAFQEEHILLNVHSSIFFCFSFSSSAFASASFFVVLRLFLVAVLPPTALYLLYCYGVVFANSPYIHCQWSSKFFFPNLFSILHSSSFL